MFVASVACPKMFRQVSGTKCRINFNYLFLIATLLKKKFVALSAFLKNDVPLKEDYINNIHIVTKLHITIT